MDNGFHETETGGETNLIHACTTLLGSPRNKKVSVIEADGVWKMKRIGIYNNFFNWRENTYPGVASINYADRAD